MLGIIIIGLLISAITLGISLAVAFKLGIVVSALMIITLVGVYLTDDTDI